MWLPSHNSRLLGALSVLTLLTHCSAQLALSTRNPTTADVHVEKIDPKHSYCFEFTWLGPEFDNSTYVNTTCGEMMDEKRAEHVPCRHPLVITDDGTLPDMNLLWETYGMQVMCKPTTAQVCARYTYYFNNKVQNVTYMCTKIFATGEGYVTNGCYTQMLGGDEVELCACESPEGPYKPCNGSGINSLGPILSLAAASLFLFNYLRAQNAPL